MASKPNWKALEAAFGKIKTLLTEDEKWGPAGDYAGQTVKMVLALQELEALQKPFVGVDRDLTFAQKSERLLKWLSTHADFKCAKIHLADDLPSEGGGRGVVTDEPIAKGQQVFQVPMSTMLSVSSAVRTTDLGLAIMQAQHLKELPTVILTMHLLCEHAKCLVKDAKTGGKAAALDTIVAAPNWVPTEVDPAFIEYAKAKGVDVSELLEHDEENCKDDSHGHSHSHSHGGSHGHSHGGKPCTGHGHGAPAPKPQHHGHSHGGKPCTGHGHGGGHDGSGHAADAKKIVPLELDVDSHPWGSHFRAYLSVLPDDPGSCLNFGVKEHRLLKGLAVSYEICKFICNSVATYCKLYDVFGLQREGSEVPLLGNVFAEHFTWQAFKWAMGNAMSRQNRVPFNGVDPLTSDNASLAMIPLYDMVNSTDPMKFLLEGKKEKVESLREITSFFMPSPSDAENGGVLVLEAPDAFAAGEEVTMSYGSRNSSTLLQFQGFIPSVLLKANEIIEAADQHKYKEVIERSERDLAEAAEKAGHKVPKKAPSSSAPAPTKEQEETALAILGNEFAVVEASMDDATAKKDPFAKIKRSLLTNLEIRPHTNAKKYLNAYPAAAMIQQTMMAFREAMVKSLNKEGKPTLPEAQQKQYQEVVDTIMWSQPFAFQVHGDGVVSPDLVSYLRVAAIDDKADAAKALRSVDGARQELAIKVKEAQEKQEAYQRKRAEKIQKKIELAKAKAAAGGPIVIDATEEEDDDDDDDEDIPVSFSLAMSQLSLNNELEAQANLLEVLDYEIERADKKALDLMASTEAAAAGSGKAGSGSSSSSPFIKAVEAYRAFQVSILRRARVRALVRLEELSQAAEAAEAAEKAAEKAAGAGGEAAVPAAAGGAGSAKQLA
jgi:hypothetical protein